MAIHFHAGEIELMQAAANNWRGLEGVGGMMTVTNYRIWFEPHGMNIQSEPEEIPLHIITEIRKHDTWGFIPNGLLIRTNTGLVRKFITWKRENIIAAVVSQQPHLQKRRS